MGFYENFAAIIGEIIYSSFEVHVENFIGTRLSRSAATNISCSSLLKIGENEEEDEEDEEDDEDDGDGDGDGGVGP